MVEINLDRKNGEYSGSNETVEVEKSDYQKNRLFESVTYTIKYINTYESSILSFFLYKSSLYLYIKDLDRKKVFSYYVSQKNHIVTKVEAYYNKNHPKVPLIIGFQGYYETKYYSYVFLKKQLSSKGFPTKEGFRAGKLDENLKAKLRDEDDRVNRVKFYNTGGNYKYCKEKTDTINIGNKLFVKISYNSEHEKRYENHELTKTELFKHEKVIDVDNSYFESVSEQYFDNVCVYRTNEQITRILLVEFKANNANKYFSRQDKHGYYWIGKEVNLNNELVQIVDSFISKLSYLINRRGIYGGVTVVRESLLSFDGYRHTPDDGSNDKTVFMLYNGKTLTLTGQSNFSGQHKLNSLVNKKICETCVYFIEGSTNSSPVFINITETPGSNNHWLQKANSNGLVWKQINDPKLSDSIAYRLDVKSDNSFYSNGNIKISKLSISTLNGYSHKPKPQHDDKKSYVTYLGTLISLEATNNIPTDQLINELQDKKLSSVDVYYKKEEPEGPPFYLELSEYSTSKKFYLLKVDQEGLRWKQIENEIAKITVPYYREKIINEAKYYTTKSIVILVNENRAKYPVNIIDFSSNKTDSFPKEQDKKVIVTTVNCLKGTNYKTYKHDISLIKLKRGDETEMSKATGFRLLIGTASDNSIKLNKQFEINIFDKDGRYIEPLYFNPLETFKKEVYVYFHSSNNVPLMICHSSTYFKPRNFEDYFNKWVEITDLKLNKPCDSTDADKIKRELNTISKSLNHINIENTNENGYGIFDGKRLSPLKEYDGKLINVNREIGLFRKVTHIPTNKSSISKLKFGEEELKGDDTKAINLGSTNSVSVYYHNSDSEYQKPLLIYLIGDGSRNESFYERKSKDSSVNWKKVTNTHLIKHRDDEIANKINNIRYNIGKSFKIRIYQQAVESESDKYQVQLVPNTNGRGDPEPVGSGQITVTQNSSTTTQPTRYTCFTHHIPKNISTNSSEYVSGLRMYICQNHYLPTHTGTGNSTTLPIYYDPDHKEVKVYFYQHTGGTSIDNLDNVPLLAEYNGKHYKPSSRDKYFTRWDKVEVTAQEVESDNDGAKTLKQVLDEINKELNSIELDRTGNTGVYKYGIKKPDSESGNCGSDTMIDEFCKRVTVKRDNGHREHYRMVTHSTNNKGPVGDLYTGRTKIRGIKLESSTLCNKLDVYYLNNDNSYNRPLLICLGSQETENSCFQWYYRKNAEGTEWEHDTGYGKYDTESSIRKQLQLIQLKLFNSISVQLENQESQYQGCIIKGGDKPQKETIGIIKVNNTLVLDTYKVDNYRCFEHKLYDYYKENTDAFVSSLKLKHPTLELAINLSKSKIGLTDLQNKSTILYFTSDLVVRQVSVYVYFFDPGGFENDDKVPLLFIFGEKCFVPESKENYFTKWKQVEMDFVKKAGDVDLNEKIKIVLNRITRMLNVINLDITSGNSYGEIKPDNLSDPLRAGKRVSITRYLGIGQDYGTVTHSTEKTGCVGTVNHYGRELEIVGNQGASTKWSEVIESELTKTPKVIYNELKTYYYKTDRDFSKPLLMKISGTVVRSDRPTPLFYERNDNITDPFKWKKVRNTLGLEKEGSELLNKLNELHYMVNKSVAIAIQQQPTNMNMYPLRLVSKYPLGNSETPQQARLDGKQSIKITPDTGCRLNQRYTCLKHSIDLGSGIKESDISGLRFYLGENEVETFKDETGLYKASIYYDNNKDVHVYFHSPEKMDTVPLMFRYNTQFFKPMSKSNYFKKWVLDAGISSSHHLQPQKLESINKMLNEIDLQQTGSRGAGGQYGLMKPSGTKGLENFNLNRITAKRDADGSKGYKTVTHTTNNRLPIGKIMFGNTALTDNSSPSQNLSQAANGETSIRGICVNAVTVYYHKTDSNYTTPILLGFGTTNRVVEPGGASAANSVVFYERENRDDITKWAKVGILDTENQKIADKLDEILYQIGQSVVIYLENQDVNGYQVKVVDNKPHRAVPKPAYDQYNIRVSKGENCTVTECESTQLTLKYTCLTHTIPDLVRSNVNFIQGLKFYISNNNHLETFGERGWPSKPVRYSNNIDVKVYFYSNGKGPPSKDLDNVPLLVQYNGIYYRPFSKDAYFTKWEEVKICASVSDGKTISNVLEELILAFNSIDISQKGGTNQGYGLYPNSLPICPCSSKNFCDLVTVKRVFDQEFAGKYQILSHSTTNGAGIGEIYHGARLIQAIDTKNVGTGCNLVNVYYAHNDATYSNPLMICLGVQTTGETQRSEAIQSNTYCKKWFRRTGIDITQWDDTNAGTEYSTYDLIEELNKVLAGFRDYLYLDIANKDQQYEVFVQHQAGEKKKVGGDGTDDKKIAVTEVVRGETEGAQLQVPTNYKGYKHGLCDFYKKSKDVIQKALNPRNGVAPNQAEDQDSTVQLRLQIAGQDLALVDSGNRPLKTPLEYKHGAGDAGTDGKNDPVVYFYGKSGSSITPDKVPLLFMYQNKYYGPKDRASYFQGWIEYSITGGADTIKQQLDSINSQLNEIDLRQTGSGGWGMRSTDYYGLFAGPGVNLVQIQTNRITVTQDVQVTADSKSTYVTVIHTTVNGYNIGSIKALGSCEFDNQHTKTLVKKLHNEAVAVYAKGDNSLQNPKLVLICSTSGLGSGGKSTVLGYYNLSNINEGRCDGPYVFKEVTEAFTVGDITKLETMKEKYQGLVEILESIGLLTPDVQAQTALSTKPVATEALSVDGHDSTSRRQDVKEEARVPPGAEVRDRSEAMDSGAKGEQGPGGKDSKEGGHGPPGSPGENEDPRLESQTFRDGLPSIQGSMGTRSSQLLTENTASNSTTDIRNTRTRNGGHPQEYGDGAIDHGSTNGGGQVDGRSGERGEYGIPGSSSDGKAGPEGDRSETGPNALSGEDGGTWPKIMEVIKKPEVYASASGVAGVGLMATVGGVVYKKCIVGSAVAAGKAAAKVAAAAASGM